MSKGVVVQTEEKNVYILKSDGSFISYPNNGLWQIGDVIAIPHKSWLSFKLISLFCSVFLVLLISSGFVIYNIPVAYVEITVNPAVQMTLNRFNKVLDVTGVNEDGINLLEGASYKNLSIGKAFARLLNRYENNNHLNGAKVQLVIANKTQRNLDSLEEDLRDVILKYRQTNNIDMCVLRFDTAEYLAMEHPIPLINHAEEEEETVVTNIPVRTVSPPRETPQMTTSGGQYTNNIILNEPIDTVVDDQTEYRQYRRNRVYWDCCR
jgi:hypothetical protein